MFIGTVNITYWGGYLVNVFANHFHYEASTFGYIICGQSVAYVIGCLLMPRFCEHLPRRLLFMVAIFCFSWTLLLLGPSKMLNFPDNPILTIVAFPLLGAW